VLCPVWNTRDVEVAAGKKKVSSSSELVLDHSNSLRSGSKSINPFPNYIGADGPISLSLACARRNTPGMGIGMKGNGVRTNSFLHKVATIKISAEVATPPVLAPDIDS
jgi:hypothetical protein